MIDVLNWGDQEIVEAYIDSIAEDSSNEIDVTKKQYHDPFLIKLLPKLKDKTILDIGCGDGYILKKISKRQKNCNLFGVDLPLMIDNARAKNKKSLISFRKGSCYDLPFDDNVFGLVISSLLFHWIDDARKKNIEMYRVLKKGGHIVVSFIHPNIFHTGIWTNLNSENPIYVINKDISKPSEFQTHINKTVGPLTYYMRPLSKYREILANACFKEIVLYEPTITNQGLMNRYPCLKKYKNYPLYVFITAKK